MIEITHEDRLKFLKAHNDLRDILMNIHECNDMWMSDIGKLEDLKCTMYRVMKFVPQEDEDGMPIYYKDWVLADETVDPDGEQPYV
jgi:hypothetical protein